MGIVSWDESLDVKVSAINDQHKRLIKLINELNEAIIEDKDKDILSTIIYELIDYTKNHFSTEEDYFIKFNYPETVEHMKEHQYFIEKVFGYKKDFEEGTIELSDEIFNFLIDWVINHIQNTDKKYSSFLNEKGLK